jgi:hypothetical protein
MHLMMSTTDESQAPVPHSWDLNDQSSFLQCVWSHRSTRSQRKASRKHNGEKMRAARAQLAHLHTRAVRHGARKSVYTEGLATSHTEGL